jgi:hypothetical protein
VGAAASGAEEGDDLVERVALGSRAEQRQRGVDGERRRAGACESPADDGDEGKGRPHVVGREQRWGVSCRPLNREWGGEETGERESYRAWLVLFLL